MKTLARLVILALIVHFCPDRAFAQTNPGSLEHMEELTGAIAELKDDTWKYLKAVTRGKAARKVEKKRQNLIEELGSIKGEISRKVSFDSETDLKQAVIEYLDMSYIVLKEDYDKILDMEDIAEQSYDNMEAYLLAKEQASEKLDQAFEEMRKAQDAFAEENFIRLVAAEEDKLDKKINNASDVLAYYNDMYLIFFKSFKQEYYALEALNKGDVSGLEQNASSLVVFSEEGEEKAQETGAFEGDSRLLRATERILNFYKVEGEEDFPKLVDFYIKQDNFERVKKLFEAKSKKKRTQQDVDQFNKAVAEYNEAVELFNPTVEGMNVKRDKYLEEWNKAVEDFFDAHGG